MSIQRGDTTTTPPGSVTREGDGSFVVTGSHAYVADGTYTVTVTVTKEDGSAARTTATVVVGTLYPGRQASLTVGSFTAANTLPADFTATINWGDGSSGTGTVAGSGGSYTVSGTHTYAVDGLYTVTVTVTGEGGATASTSQVVQVTRPPAGGAGNEVVSNAAGAVVNQVVAPDKGAAVDKADLGKGVGARYLISAAGGTMKNESNGKLDVYNNQLP